MFSYSERPNTQAQRKLTDDVPDEVKKRRLQELLSKCNTPFEKPRTRGKAHKVLVEGVSKKSEDELFNETPKIVGIPKENYEAGTMF